MLSITSDFRRSTGSARPYLERIASAGFTHIHFCHHWNTDFSYFDVEIEEIDRWLLAYKLRLLDLHGSSGVEKCWMSPVEYERLAGIELVKNRIRMTARLGGDAVVMHLDAEPIEEGKNREFWERLHATLDSLAPSAQIHGVRIALENLAPGNFATIERVFTAYPPDYVGLCYDSGHGNITGDGLDCLERLANRLIVTHLHDNDGMDDQHKPLFSGTVDWDRLAEIIAHSDYKKCLSVEVSMRESDFTEETTFLEHVFATGTRFSQMVERQRA